jgi:hypothetical protein
MKMSIAPISPCALGFLLTRLLPNSGTRRLKPAILVPSSLLLLSAATASGQQLAYRAAFSNDSGAAQSILPFAWTVIEGGGPLASARVDPIVSRSTRDEFRASSPFGVGLAEGVVSLTASAVPRTVLLVTGEPAITVSIDSLHGVSWDWTGGNSRAHLARPAVKVNGRWFVANCPPYLTVNSTAFASAALRAEYLFPSHDSVSWKPLPPSLSTEDTAQLTTAPVALTGYVEEIGLWVRFGGTPGTIRIDNFEITLR